MNLCRLTVVNLGILILQFWGLVKRKWMMMPSWGASWIHRGQFLRSLPLRRLPGYTVWNFIGIHLTMLCLFLTYAFLAWDNSNPVMFFITLLIQNGGRTYNLISDHYLGMLKRLFLSVRDGVGFWSFILL